MKAVVARLQSLKQAREIIGSIVGFSSRTLEKMLEDRVYLGVEKKKSGCVAVTSRQHHPPVCHELACSTISHIIPQYRLTSTLLSNSRPGRNGVRHCLLPRMYPNHIPCCLGMPALPPHPVFSLNKHCHLMRLRGDKRCYRQETTNGHVEFFAAYSDD